MPDDVKPTPPGADASAAGVLPLLEEIEVVDMDGFVALTERYPRQLAWY